LDLVEQMIRVGAGYPLPKNMIDGIPINGSVRPTAATFPLVQL
jgi:hypothetical protein